MNKIRLIGAGFVLCAAGAVHASGQSSTATSQAQPPVAESAAKDEPEEATAGKPKLDCRTESTVGSRFSKKVCRTAETRAELRRASREFTERGQNRSREERAGGG